MLKDSGEGLSGRFSPDFYFSIDVFQPAGPGQPAHPVLKRCAQVLDPMARAVPGLLEALYLLGKVKFLSGRQHFNFVILKSIGLAPLLTFFFSYRHLLHLLLHC